MFYTILTIVLLDLLIFPPADRVSSIPIVDDNGALLDVYSLRFDT
jgi:hypothetical protein